METGINAEVAHEVVRVSNKQLGNDLQGVQDRVLVQVPVGVTTSSWQ